MSDDLTIGQSVKVWLPGESPWAIVIGKMDDGRILARLDNDLVMAGHDYRYGDVATFEKETTSEWSIWKLAPLDRQIKIGPSALTPARDNSRANHERDD